MVDETEARRARGEAKIEALTAEMEAAARADALSPNGHAAANGHAATNGHAAPAGSEADR